MKKILSVLLTLVFISGTMAFAAPFPDLPADHWATEAVNVLAEKGLVEGYPNGTFKGNRAATRYEVAMVVARLVAYLEKRPQVTKEDLEAIKRLVNEFKDELDAMGVRLKNVEDLLASLEKRVTELERIRFSGGFQTRFTSNLISTCAACTMTRWQMDGTAAFTRLPLGANPNSDVFQYDSTSLNSKYPGSGSRNGLWDKTNLHNADRENSDWLIEDFPFDKNYTAYPAHSGSALTQLGYLKIAAKLSDDYTAGGVVSFYNNVGQTGNGFIYGVTPPTIANPFQAGTAVFGGTTSSTTSGLGFFGTSSTNLSTSLNQIFVTSDTQNLHVTVGDWRPALISDHILQGLPNMGVFGPDYLPFYGGQLYGKMGGTVASGMEYEVAAGRISVFEPTAAASFNAGLGTATTNFLNFQNIVLGGALGYDWRNAKSTLSDVHLTGSFVRVMNDNATAGGGAVAGFNNIALWANPINVAGWGGTPLPLTLNNGAGSTSTTTLNTGVGPQTENLYGGEVRAKFGNNWKWLTAWGKYGNSNYQVSRGSAVGVSTSSGSMGAGGIVVNDGGKITGGGEFLWVSPYYDPFIAEIPAPTTAFAGPNPSMMWMGFPYPVSYGPPFTNVIGSLFITAPALASPATTNPFTSADTAGGGDIFYNIHDSRKYPANRTGFRANTNWDYGHGNVGGRVEYLQQAQTTTLGAELSPGFYEPLFFSMPTSFVGPSFASTQNISAFYSAGNPVKGSILDWTGYVNYTTPSKEVTVDAVYTDSRMKRLEPDFNNIDLHFISWRGGLTYRPTEKWTLLAGWDQFSSVGNGRYLEPYVNQTGSNVTLPGPSGTLAGATIIPANTAMPPNMLFAQTGPYGGVNYSFAKWADGWIMYHVYNMKDNNLNGFSGYVGTEIQSGMRFMF